MLEAADEREQSEHARARSATARGQMQWSGQEWKKTIGSNKKIFSRTNNFKGANENILTLYTKAERRQKDQYVLFQRSLEQYVTTNFSNAGDILPLVRDLVDPIVELVRNIPRKETAETYLSSVSSSSPSPPLTQPQTPDNITTSNAGNDEDQDSSPIDPEAAALQE